MQASVSVHLVVQFPRVRFLIYPPALFKIFEVDAQSPN